MNSCNSSQEKRNTLRLDSKSLEYLKHPDYTKLEKEILDYWDFHRIFELLQKKNKHGKHFRFFDGPITANGVMGVHHVRGRALKDTFQRFKSMCGYKTRYQNGFDCQGLWVEVQVERALGLDSKKAIAKYGEKKFVRKCSERVNHFADLLTKQSIRLGQWMDWKNSYYTHHDTNIEHIWHFLKSCYEKGWLYQGNKVLPWCPRCGTSLSTHEQSGSYKDLTHTSVFLRLPVKNELNTYFLVWTTTPWTLPANVALAVNPSLTYLKVKCDDSFYYLASKTQPFLKESWKKITEITGSSLVGKQYIGPFEELPAQNKVKKRRVIAWEKVSNEEGTGIVHIAPGCGEEDFDLGKKENLTLLAPIDEEAKYVTGYEYFEGLYVKRADALVIDKLTEKNLLYLTAEYTHRYPTCWRCGTEIVFKLEKEWFLNSSEVRPMMVREAKKVKWQPEHTELAMVSWLENMGDWCISRKRYWGLPLPFYNCSCGELTVIGCKTELRDLAVKKDKVDLLPELHKPWIDEIKIYCPKCQQSVERVSEVGDCWLDAGVVPFSTLNYMGPSNHDFWCSWFPAELVVEMQEQVRLWFYSMLFMSVTLTGRSPYENVLAFDMVLQKEGKKFSKTASNNLEFDEVVNQFGADPLRWLNFSYPAQQKIYFDMEEIIGAQKKLLQYWNTVYFLASSVDVDGLNYTDLLKYQKNLKNAELVDQWILVLLDYTILEVRKKYSDFDAYGVFKCLDSFVDNLSNWYVRLNRRRFWKSDLDKSKKKAYGTLYKCLLTLTKLMAPLVPFTSEYVYQNLVPYKDQEIKSVHLEDFPKPSKNQLAYSLIEKFDIFKKVVSMVLMLRNKAQIRVRQPLSSLKIWTSNTTNQQFLQEMKPYLVNELNVKKIEILNDIPQGVKLQIVVDYKKLGPKYKELLPAITEILEVINQESVAKYYHNEVPLKLKLNGETITLQPDEYKVETVNRKDEALLVSDGLGVVLDLSMTTDLLMEGYMRDLVRHIQNLRNELDLYLTQIISVSLKFEEPIKGLATNLEPLFAYLKEETLIDKLLINESLPNAKLVRKVSLGDGTVKIEIST